MRLALHSRHLNAKITTSALRIFSRSFSVNLCLEQLALLSSGIKERVSSQENPKFNWQLDDMRIAVIE